MSERASAILRADIRAHDDALRARGIVVWIGAEPTFTRRDSQEPVWLWQGEGADKEERARALLVALLRHLDGPAIVRKVLGRQFPGEPRPRFAYGALFRRDGGVVEASSGAARALALEAGAPPLDGAPLAVPAVDAAHAWLTVTPDPGVVEVNMAPATDLTTFARWTRGVFAAATEAGLSPLRYRFNGHVSDSGGGGQITLGGPSALESPFLRYPALLPRLLRYTSRHPSLSYGFSPECNGSASQGPRADEGVRERFEELGVALDLLDARARANALKPDELWSTLAPLLVDGSGNAHRAELNVEKLWNPYAGERGHMGVVEFRAMRMQPTPERMIAVAALLRAVAARLALFPYDEPLADWGAELHDRFALPSLLAIDLREVLADLAEHGFGLGPELARVLSEPREPRAVIELDGARLTVTPALEFWPLLGDVASQENRSARLVDASAERIEIVVRPPPSEREPEHAGEVSVCGVVVPLTPVTLADGAPAFIGAVRYRAFVPQPGLHPQLTPQDPLVIAWSRRGADRARAMALHAWIPCGGAYDGVPADAAEAAARRRARVVTIDDAADLARAQAAPRGAVRGFTLDLRRLEARRLVGDAAT